MGQVLLQLEKVFRTYYIDAEPIHALRGVDLDIPAGRLVVIKGPSGSGKTTILNVMGGLDSPTSGRVLFQGRDIGLFRDRELTEWRRETVGFVFQSFGLIQTLTAFENVELPMRITGQSWAKRQQRVNEALSMVGLTERAHHRIFELSGGEQQRVGIARAFVNHSKLILADEPTGELDYRTGAQIMTFFKQLVSQQGVTICVATHDPATMAFGDITLEIRDGQFI